MRHLIDPTSLREVTSSAGNTALLGKLITGEDFAIQSSQKFDGAAQIHELHTRLTESGNPVWLWGLAPSERTGRLECWVNRALLLGSLSDEQTLRKLQAVYPQASFFSGWGIESEEDALTRLLLGAQATQAPAPQAAAPVTKARRKAEAKAAEELPF
jgi:hypothetical protein